MLGFGVSPYQLPQNLVYMNLGPLRFRSVHVRLKKGSARVFSPLYCSSQVSTNTYLLVVSEYIDGTNPKMTFDGVLVN